MRELGRRGVEGREGVFFREAEVERLGLERSIISTLATCFCQTLDGNRSRKIWWKDGYSCLPEVSPDAKVAPEKPPIDSLHSPPNHTKTQLIQRANI